MPIILLSLLLLGALIAPSRAAEPCGFRIGDWCPAPAGDPCGRHRTLQACVDDQACRGMPYQGESVVACQHDARGFGLNCPTVGCVSGPR